MTATCRRQSAQLSSGMEPGPSSFLPFLRSTKPRNCCRSRRRPSTTGAAAGSCGAVQNVSGVICGSSATACFLLHSIKESQTMKERKSDSVPVGDRVSIYMRGGTWYCNYQDGHRQVRKSLKTTSRRQAFLKVQKIETQLQEGVPSRQVQETTVAAAAEAFLEHAVVESDQQRPSRSTATCSLWSPHTLPRNS